MNRIALLAIALDATHKILQRVKTIYLRLKRISHHLIKTSCIGIQHHDGHLHTLLPQRHTLVGKCHREIAHAQVLHQLRHLHIARSIAVGLDHRHQTVIHLQKRPEISDVVRHRIEIHLQDGRVATTFQRVAHPLEVRAAITLEQYRPPRQIHTPYRLHQLLGRCKEAAFSLKPICIARDSLPHAYHQIHPCVLNHRRHAGV